MVNTKKWFQTVTFGQTKKYIILTLWNMLDSFVVTIPYAVMLMAIYLLLIPIASIDAPLPTNRLWILSGILLIQTVMYFFISRKTYISVCIGFAETSKKARLSMGEHLRILSMGFFNKRDAGDLSTVLLRDYTEVENLANGLIPQISSIVVRLLLSVIVLSALDWRMLLSLIVAIPLALPFAYISYKLMGKVSRELLTAQQESAFGILEYVGGIKTLKAFNQTGEHFKTLKQSFKNMHKHSVGMEIAATPVAMIGRFVLNCGICIVMLVGVNLLTSGELSPFYYIAFLLISLNIYQPVMAVFAFISDFARTNRSAERINEIMDENALDEPQNSIQPKRSDIIFDRVTFSYGEKKVLNTISMDFPANSITALVGPSGSGKTTITRLIARFWDVDNGEISIGGIPYTKMKTDDLLSQISMVFQDVYLFHDTIEANIRMGNQEATMDEIRAAAKTAACHDFISALPNGYNTIVGEGGSTLSGGEKQRISIARALLKNAPIVLLDEATASLDPENEVFIQKALSALVAEKTVIVIAHRLQSIYNADQIIVLKNGAIQEKGTHEELLENDSLYASLWKDQRNAGNWKII